MAESVLSAVTNHLPVDGIDLRLRLLAERDAPQYSLGVNDAQTRRYAYMPDADYSETAVRDLIAGDYREAMEQGIAAYLAIADRVSDECLGSMVLFDPQPADVEIGFWLTPAGRGRGAAVTAVELATELCRRLGLTRVRARVELGNDAAAGVLTRAGFRPVGEPQPPITQGIGDFLLQRFDFPIESDPD